MQHGKSHGLKGLLALLLALVFTLAHQAHAQTSLNAGGANGGSVIVGFDSRTCDSSIEGAVRYHSTGGGGPNRLP